MILFPSLSETEAAPLLACGYETCGMRSKGNRRFYVLRDEQMRSLCHHPCFDDPAAFDELIRFRNRLCANPVLAKQDKALKCNLTRRYPNERARCTESKRTFMRSDCKDCAERPTAPDLQAWPESLCAFGAQTMNRLRPAQNMRRKSFVRDRRQAVFVSRSGDGRLLRISLAKIEQNCYFCRKYCRIDNASDGI